MERGLSVGWNALACALLSIVAILLASTSAVTSQTIASSCKVSDPELQSSYIGSCANGLAEGHGEATGVAHYKGDFKAGRKHGKGVKFWPSSGDRYVGEFLDDRKDGTGVYTWGPRSPWAGEKYTGSYLKDLRQGYGVYEWPSGDRYTGPWADDVATGPVTRTMKARARQHVEAVAALGKPGITVCREMKVGIGTREWIRGTVMTIEDDSIAVRIDETGQLGHVIRGVPVEKGTVIKDDSPNWIPC